MMADMQWAVAIKLLPQHVRALLAVGVGTPNQLRCITREQRNILAQWCDAEFIRQIERAHKRLKRKKTRRVSRDNTGIRTNGARYALCTRGAI